MAHKTGKLTCLVSHPNAPVFASANASSVVKLWSESGDLMTGIRATPAAGAPQLRIGKTTCMAFAPFEQKLAAGASDAHVSVYTMSPQSSRKDEAQAQGAA